MHDYKFGLIGHPISDSGSPALFKKAYAGKYRYELIEGDDFSTSWQRFIQDSYLAINVTAPFKEMAFRASDIQSGPCIKIGATNLVVKSNEGTVALNSDFTGIILSIAEAYLPGIVREFYARYGNEAYIKVHQYFQQAVSSLFPQTPQALIVGCGGAGRAAAVAAAEMGFETALMNRTAEKANILAQELPEYKFIAVPISDFRASLKECELVIYTVPTAISDIEALTEDDFRGEEDYRGLRPSKVILEANYKTPAFSGDTAAKMQNAGCQYVSGGKWLYYQALTGYSLMTHEVPAGLL